MKVFFQKYLIDIYDSRTHYTPFQVITSNFNESLGKIVMDLVKKGSVIYDIRITQKKGFYVEKNKK